MWSILRNTIVVHFFFTIAMNPFDPQTYTSWLPNFGRTLAVDVSTYIYTINMNTFV